ncbi:MAG: hypothetical protein KDA17_05480, partial [Candidatus Saccharibacteria bacterium]|nr:hypothetical protein [Candidatus Saccharibacteria bacterium]
VRIANIDRSALTVDASSGANLPDLMFQALERLPNLSTGRAAFYMDRGITTKLRQQSTYGVKSSTLTSQNLGGTMVTSFHEVPIRRVDAMSADEARVV